MGLFGSMGLKNAFAIGALIGQDIVARSISLTSTAAGAITTAGSMVYTGAAQAWLSATGGGAKTIAWAAGGGADMTYNGAGAFTVGGAWTSTGIMSSQNGFGFTDFVDDSANSGNRTVNTNRGKNAIAIGAATCVITNNKVTANSQVICTLEFADATATIILRCIPAAGSFTLTVNAAATAATKFSWVVLN